MTFPAGLSARRAYFFLALSVLVLDQATKILVHAFLRSGGPVEIVHGLFNLVYARNRGGLFGYFRDLPDFWRVALLTLLPVVAIGLVATFLARTEETDRRTLLGLSLILGGAIGNLLDRLFRGEVVDFLDVYVSQPRLSAWLIEHFGTAHWPTFNLADSAIVCGAVLLALTTVLPHRPAPPDVSPSVAGGETAGPGDAR